jgi:hypothetical protein
MANLWTLINEVTGSFEAHFEDAQDEAFESIKHRIAGIGAYPLSLARSSYPDPFPISRFSAMYPWNAYAAGPGRLEALVDQGIIIREGDGFLLSDDAREAIDLVHRTVPHQVGARLDLLPDADMHRLKSLLENVLAACEATPLITQKWGMQHTYWMRPDDAPQMIGPLIEMYLAGLQGWRDDAHIAVWRTSGVSGPAWETMTLIWGGKAQTLDDVTKALAFRRHDTETYRQALDELVAQGWLSQQGQHYQVNDAGRQMRIAAENETEDNWRIGFASLNSAELQELETLLIRLRDRLNEV